ncbi:MAG: BLUF domain-containing protein [Bradymonadales bacterium]|nr:MAG: BLUF domain-containing protein [Bradymonadales bacterium]
MDFWILYTSLAKSDLSEADLKSILEEARSTNQKLEITGILLKRNGYFIQLLEGPVSHVKKVYAKIIADKRHSNIQLLLESAAPQRIFPGWHMGFVDAANTDTDLLVSVKSAMESMGDLKERVLSALQVFSDVGLPPTHPQKTASSADSGR